MLVHWTRIYLCLMIITGLFLVVGCGSFYKILGVPPAEVDKLVQDDSLRTLQAVQEGRTIFWQAATAVMSSLGAVVSVLLGKYLQVERKMSKAMIMGIEKVEGNTVKGEVAKQAARYGVDDSLKKRVIKLTE